MPSHHKRRSPRLRKKLRVAEFQELGFSITVEIHPSASADAQDTLLVAFIAELIEPYQCAYGGGVHHGFVCGAHRHRKIRETDRERVAAWFSGRDEVMAIHLGDIEDCWHPGQPLYEADAPRKTRAAVDYLAAR